MPEDNERDVGQVTGWAARWRELERKAFNAANATADPEAKRKMLFVAESYKLLAERLELRDELRAALEDKGRMLRFGPQMGGLFVAGAGLFVRLPQNDDVSPKAPKGTGRCTP
jgi:hypothetical protein